jgi:predicted Zn-dependent peptidase
VKSFDRTTFEKYQADCYTPDQIIVSIAGNPNEHDWMSELEQVFEPKSGTKARTMIAARDKQTKPAIKVEHRKTDQTHLVLSLRTFPQTDERRFILGVLSTILGGTMSSRLFNEIREKRGLAYYVRSGADGYHDAGSFAVSTGANNASAKEAVTVILAELKKLKDELVSKEELARAKENFRGKLALQLEESSSVGSFLAEQELYFGHQLQPEELIEKVNAVTTKDIQSLAQEFFVKEHLNLAAVGPFKNEDFQPLLEKAL